MQPVVLCFPQITIKGRRMEIVDLNVRTYSGSKQEQPSISQRTAVGVLRRSSDTQAKTGRTPGRCQGYKADGMPSFSLVKCDSSVKELVFSVFNTQPSLCWLMSLLPSWPILLLGFTRVSQKLFPSPPYSLRQNI